MASLLIYLIALTIFRISKATNHRQFTCYDEDDAWSRAVALLELPDRYQSMLQPAITSDPGFQDQYKFDLKGNWESSDYYRQQCEVIVVVHGDRGKILNALTIKQVENRDSLYVNGSEIGKLKYVQIKLSTTDARCVWHIRNVEVNNLYQNHQSHLPCKASVAPNRVRRAVQRHMKVAVKTHSDNWSGNDNGVNIKIIGTTGTSYKIHVNGDGGLYVDGWNTKEVYDIGDIGIIKQIEFSHDGDEDYKLRYVRIEEMESTGSTFHYFDCECWFTDEHLSEIIDIKLKQCPVIPHCVSQLCKTCDECDTALGSRHCELNSAKTACMKGADIAYCDTGKQTCDKCSQCIGSDGTHFYATSPDQKKCFKCSHIENCKEEVCLSDDGQSCTKCNNVITEIAGKRGYRAPDDKRSCKQTCSWMSNSNRCYPGVCPEEYVENCECSEGFEDKHCETITIPPTILETYITFDNTFSEALAPLDPNIVTDQERSWTNLENIRTVEVNFKSTFIPPGQVPTRPDYVLGYKVGIIKGTINFKFFRGGKEEVNRRQTFQCSGVSESSPQKEPRCLEKYNFEDFVSGPLQTNDALQFELAVENGGYITVNLHSWIPRSTYNYIGKKVSSVVEMFIDYVVPYHCSEKTEICTAESMLRVTNITQEATVGVSWDGWRDDDSGLNEDITWKLEVFEMEFIQSVSGLRNKKRDSYQEFNISYSEANVTMTEKGIYSVELSAFDKARNYRKSRRILIYDEESEVSVTKNVLRVTSSAKTASWEWQWKSDSVTIDWEKRYINKLHDELKWLEAAADMSDVDNLYDDQGYSRGINAIPNVQAIVEYQSAYLVDHNGGNTLTSVPGDSNFTSRGLSQSHTISPTLVDGDTLRYWIRAYDVRDEYLEENVTVHIDTSPPIIENLWLTRGDRLNVSVHRMVELNTMTIEWEAYDDHSGLETVSWRLFDNFTGTDILHGQQHITAQGDAVDQTSCISKYGGYPRGSNCYCTPGVGCYHRHYQVKPTIGDASQGGIYHSKYIGGHDHDYFLEVTVMNHAHLSTTLDFKVTVDASPPHPGVVHDGGRTFPEVDYQSNPYLYANWDGFFDKESGVKFYQYGFATQCLQKTAFALDLRTVQVQETYSTEVSWNAPSSGRFYITVVAYNRALEPSNPVCSDGVTVDYTGPVLSQIAVLNSRTTEGLVKTAGGEVWFISFDRRRSKINQPDNLCTQKSKLVGDKELRMLPLHLFTNGSAVTHRSSLCPEHTGFSLAHINTFYLLKDDMLYVNWTGTDSESGIYDYEFGLMSNPSGVGAPNILPYTSTHHHPHYQGYHPALSQGQQFYIAVKAINKAGVSTPEILGPVTVHTQAPSFTGSISVVLDKTFLVASWTTTDFTDPEQNYQHYHFSIGSSPGGTDVLPFRPIQTGGSCLATTPPSCTAVDISDLHWDLHHSHTYYISIKVTNIVGLFTVGVSDPYKHDVRVPSPGVVLDVSPQEEHPLFDITEYEDTDFQLSTTTLDARWFGFDDGLDGVTYKACIGTAVGLEDVRACEDAAGPLSHHFQNLNLQANKKYFVTVVATNEAGEQRRTSDGVTVIQKNIDLIGISVSDAENCDAVSKCVGDITYQMSTTSYTAHWSTTPLQKQRYPESYIKLERKLAHADDLWTTARDYENHGLVQHATLVGLSLDPGMTYRASIKFCAVNVCTNPVYSDGVTVLSHAPVSEGVNVTYSERGELSQIEVLVDRYRDPDISGMYESYGVMDRYEWSLTDNSHSDSMLIHWTPVSNPIIDGDQVTFTINLSKHLTFTKCHRVAVRGYNKVGVYTIVSADIRDCDVIRHPLIKPTLVIDAIGSKKEEDIDQGGDIKLDENAKWDFLDVDYTPYKNVLSAVWPSLRHHNYTWAVVTGINVDPTFHFKRESLMTVSDPCTLPDVVQCGRTENEFINIHFKENEYLQHGKRYYVCIHADEIIIEHEKWPDHLLEVNVCSDGVTVDLTPPNGGTVTVTGLKEGIYQVSQSEVSVSWDGFTDVEESGHTPHPRGISHYQLALGSVPDGEDILAMTDVGLVNHFTVQGLRLHDGQSVFVSVLASDFVNKTRRVPSAGVVVDSSPPEKTERQILLEDRYVTKYVISVCWDGVLHDPHSGIKYYDVSFGSRPGQADIVPLTHVEDVCGQFDTESKLPDGHSFYISVKGINNAGLSTVATSHALVVDTTPPSVGNVFDGQVIDVMEDAKDKDYVTRIEDMGAHWEGFADPHSPVNHFKVKVGICPGCEDIVAEYEAAARTDVVFSERYTVFEEGTKYYVTVTACNKAGLCSSATSDGVILDSSPPVPGRVMDGTQDRDIQYQASRTFIGCKWNGFQDPESGLDYYEWRVGTTPGGQDILPPTHVALQEITFHNLSPGTLLPVGQRIFITVRAYNKAGLYSESTSNGFLVDNTPPGFSLNPRIAGGQGSIVAMTIISRTTIKIEWGVGDSQSFIERQFISIWCQRLGEFESTPLQLPGVLREFTYTNLDLHDGGLYKVKVTACNMAGMCTTAESGTIRVDGSIPLTGTLAVKTDHAARLSRHQSNGMTWTATSLILAWLGFTDLHSGITHYIITVGSRSFATDLANNELPKQANHDHSGVDMDDEGVVQIYTIDTKDISSRTSVFVAVWAVNGVGLRSSPLHSELILGEGGQLELVRRCTPYNCEGHCVCAEQDKKCAKSNACNELAGGGGNAIITVSDVISLTNMNPDAYQDVNFSPIDTVLAATWGVTGYQGQLPVRYEFSAGRTDYHTPKGIFNVALDRLWFDAGTSRIAVVTLDQGQKLTPGLRYSVFVRVWYNDNTYSIFKSNGVLIDNTRPTFTDKLGMAVKEHKDSTRGKDVDFQSFTDKIHLSWDGKFLPGDSGLLKYSVYVSTAPGGHGIGVGTDVMSTAYTVSGLSLEPATVYFSCVQAYNRAGLVGWMYSDGVQPDTKEPVVGFVQDGEELHDIDYQSSPTDVAASWFGFSDIDSAVVKYFWCVGTTNDTEECSLSNWQDVGLHTSARTQLDSPLSDDAEVWTKVYAVDTVGHRSFVAVSDGVKIDTSPPEIKEMVYLGDNLVSNPSFEIDEGAAVSTDVDCNHLIPASWEVGADSCIKVLTPNAPNAKHGKTHLAVSGRIHQNMIDLVAGKTYLLTVHVGYPETLTVNHKAVEGSVSMGREVFTFSLDPQLCKGLCQVDEQSSILWSTLKYKFMAEATSADLTIATASRDMEVVVDHVTVQAVENAGDATTMESQQHLALHPVFLPHWSAVHASWYFTDDNSPITEYTWAAGTVPGGTQIQKFVSVGRHSHGTLTGLRLTHNQKLYLTITARNAAGLTTVSHPDPITVDMTPPIFSLIIDGKFTDIDYQKVGDVFASWRAVDVESGLHSCDWAIGKTPGGSDIKQFEVVPTGQTTAKFDFNDVLTSSSMKVFTTVRCFNWMGHMATATSDGVTVIRVDTPPTVKGLEVLEDVVPYLYGRGDCQSSKDVRLQWTRDELQSTVIEITDETNIYQENVLSHYEFATLSGLRVQNLTTYHMEIFPKPVTGVNGDITPLNFTFHGEPPRLKESKLITVTRKGDTFSLSWAGLFISPWKDLLYAVHVGTVRGGADILERNLRKTTKIQLNLKSAAFRNTAAYLSVTAVDPCGYTSHFTQKFNFNP